MTEEVALEHVASGEVAVAVHVEVLEQRPLVLVEVAVPVCVGLAHVDLQAGVCVLPDGLLVGQWESAALLVGGLMPVPAHVLRSGVVVRADMRVKVPHAKCVCVCGRFTGAAMKG